MVTDETLYFNYINGDEDALRELLERHRQGLILFIYGIVGNMEDAEDLMIDTFAALLAKDKLFRSDSTFKTWLFAISRNKAISFLRKRHFASVEPEPENYIEDEIDAQLLQDERHKILFEAMKKLKSDYRQALLLVYFEDMDVCQTAAVMKISSRKTSDLIYRGKQALKKELKRDGYIDAQLGLSAE